MSTTSKLTEEELAQLKELSVQAKTNVYAPYSNFRVGAALLTSCGKYFTGCNVENVSYGLAICAERTAYVKAVSEGYRSFKACAVSTDVEGRFTYPCGACRQFMSEFGDIEVLVTGNDGEKYELTMLNTLLPNSFDNEALENGQKKMYNIKMI